MSYITHTEANTYFVGRFDSGSWASATSASQQSALTSSYNRLNQEYYNGQKNVFGQSGSFPRSGLVDRDDEWISPSVVPQDVKDAQAELAFAMITGEYAFEATSTTYDQVNIGPIGLTYSDNVEAAGVLPDLVVRLLSPFQRNRNRTVRT